MIYDILGEQNMKKQWMIASSFLFLSSLLCGCTGGETSEEKKGYEVEVTSIVCKDQRKIYAEIYRPVDFKGEAPAIVMSHGYSVDHKDVALNAQYFSEQGFICVTFDYCGGSLTSKSDGKFEDMTIETEYDDLDEVVHYTMNLEDVNEEKMILFGCSQGGFMSTLYASENLDIIDGLLLFYPSFCIPEKAVNGTSAAKGEKYNEVAKKYAPVENILEKVKDLPILIFHGNKDKTVDLHYSQDAMKIFQNAELVVIDGANHGFNMYKMGEVLVNEINPKAYEFLNQLK